MCGLIPDRSYEEILFAFPNLGSFLPRIVSLTDLYPLLLVLIMNLFYDFFSFLFPVTVFVSSLSLSLVRHSVSPYVAFPLQTLLSFF